MAMWIETSVERRGSGTECKNAAGLNTGNVRGLLQMNGLGFSAEPALGRNSSGNTAGRPSGDVCYPSRTLGSVATVLNFLRGASPEERSRSGGGNLTRFPVTTD